jgi:hypothetical protein
VRRYWAPKEDKTTIAAERISLFTVPLRCPAAPDIGCGPISKPILLQLERERVITQAWLSGTGTVLAVVWAGNDGQETRAQAVQAVFETNALTATELDGEARDTELKSFRSAEPWYRGAEVDNLSKQEAAIIAARLVRRVQARVEVSAETAKTLETGLTQAFIKAYNDGFVGQADRLPAFAQELLKVARTNLEEKGVAAFQEAFTKGYLPQAEDNEGTKRQAPDCCSPKATSAASR